MIKMTKCRLDMPVGPVKQTKTPILDNFFG